MDQRTFDIKVKELAEKLKNTGVVTSDAMAKNMAQDIIKTEIATRDKYEQPKQQQASAQQESQQEPSGDQPKNMVVEQAIKNAQGSAHQARVDDGINQEKSISELLEEDAKDAQQPKITLDNPVVENGVSRQEKETPPADLGVQQTPPDARGSGAVTPQRPIPASQESSAQVTPQEPISSEALNTQEPPQPKPEPVQPQPSQEKSATESSEPKKEKKADDRPDIDLSEMFNFSKK